MTKFKAGCLLLAGLTVLAVLGPALCPADPLAINLSQKLLGVSLSHPMGTDQLGRDLFSRVVCGTRISFGAAFAVTGICLAVGTLVGSAAGFFGGWTDQVLMRLVDMLMAFPSFLLPVAVAGLLGASTANLILALCLTTWTGYARMVRSSVLTVRQQLYVEAAEVMGSRRLRVIRDHVVPNAVYPLVVYATMHAGHTILAIAGLSFMGLGAQPPAPEWGAMLSEAVSFMGYQPALFIFPGMAVMTAVFAFNLLGEGLRDRMDPKQGRAV